MTNGNDLAFARPAFYHPEGGISHPQDGLTKREHMSIEAMQGFLSAQKTVYLDVLDMQCIAEDSVKIADELIKALNKEQ